MTTPDSNAGQPVSFSEQVSSVLDDYKQIVRGIRQELPIDVQQEHIQFIQQITRDVLSGLAKQHRQLQEAMSFPATEATTSLPNQVSDTLDLHHQIVRGIRQGLPLDAQQEHIQFMQGITRDVISGLAKQRRVAGAA